MRLDDIYKRINYLHVADCSHFVSTKQKFIVCVTSVTSLMNQDNSVDYRPRSLQKVMATLTRSDVNLDASFNTVGRDRVHKYFNICSS